MTPGFRFVENLGVIGPDKGKGGKYLFLPPDYNGAVPEGYFIVKTRTYNNLMFLRGSIANGLEPAVENIKSKLKIYPLAKADNPPATEFINISGKSYSTIVTPRHQLLRGSQSSSCRSNHRCDWPGMRGQLASIGIVKGKPFKPDARMKKLLNEAANLGSATARAITYQPRIDGVFIYPDTNSAWTTAYANKNTSFEADGRWIWMPAAVLLQRDRRHPRHGDEPSWRRLRISFSVSGCEQKSIRRRENYKLHLPPNVPVNNFWAVTLYDTQTRSLLQTDQRFPNRRQPEQGLPEKRGRLLRCLFRPESAGRQREQLAANHSRQELVHRSCACMARWSHGSTRPGDRERSNSWNRAVSR